jgi:bifunctional non-homologous end joining protein LigD
MTDQLSLELEAGLPHLPARLRPMLPRLSPAPFDSAEHVFEPSWGGQRALAFLEPAFDQDEEGRFHTADGAPSVRLVDAGGRDLADRLGELGGLALRIEARSAVLDGELVVVDGAGRPDPAALEERLAGRPGPDVAYLAFDVLYLDGRPLLGQPLTRRREALRRILRPGPEVVALPAIVGEGRALHDAATAQGWPARWRASGRALPARRAQPALAVRARRTRGLESSPAGRPGREPTSRCRALPQRRRRTADPRAGGGPGDGAVLAVFRRLPLDVDGD